jgi:hypothetical protein
MKHFKFYVIIIFNVHTLSRQFEVLKPDIQTDSTIKIYHPSLEFKNLFQIKFPRFHN